MKTPWEYHESNHGYLGGVDFHQCSQCRRDRAVCARKNVFRTMWDAWVEATLLNEENEYVRPLHPYRCRWCLLWHHTSTLDKFRRHRMEQRRRKWLIKQRESEDGRRTI